MNTQSLTQAEARELFDYDGKDLICRVARGVAKAGSVAGGIRSSGYNKCHVNGKDYYTHRLIWLWVHGEWPKGEIDHIDGNPSNNRIENLRDVSRLINMRNKKPSPSNTSGINGVRWNKKAEKWYARIKVEQKDIHLGSFDCKYKAASVRHFAQEIEGGFTDRHGK